MAASARLPLSTPSDGRVVVTFAAVVVSSGESVGAAVDDVVTALDSAASASVDPTSKTIVLVCVAAVMTVASTMAALAALN